MSTDLFGAGLPETGITYLPDKAGRRGYIEPFPSSLCGVNLQGVDGLGELSSAPGAAAELAEDSPGLELCIGALAGCSELRVGAVSLFLGFGLVLSPVRDLRMPRSLVALVGENDQADGLQFVQDAPDPLGFLVVDRAGQRPLRPTAGRRRGWR